MFHYGDVVRVLEDMVEVHRLQTGHGEWNDDMALVKTPSNIQQSGDDLAIVLKLKVCNIVTSTGIAPFKSTAVNDSEARGFDDHVTVVAGPPVEVQVRVLN